MPGARVNFESLTQEQFNKLAEASENLTEKLMAEPYNPEDAANKLKVLESIANDIPSDEDMKEVIEAHNEDNDILDEFSSPASEELVSKALNKAQKENQRDAFVLNMLSAQCDSYYNKYRFYPSGKERRTMKRKIEKNYDAGKYANILNSNLN